MGCVGTHFEHNDVTPAPVSASAQLSAPVHVAVEDMQRRLKALGETASIELSPGQISEPLDQISAKTPKKPPYTLVSAFSAARANNEAAPLLRGTAVFVNMVKKSTAHFDDVARAMSTLRSLDLQPVPHLPACRFDSAAELDATLVQLHAACGGGEAASVLLLGGNDQYQRNESGSTPFPSATSLLSTGALSNPTHRFSKLVLGGHPDGHPGLGNMLDATATLLETKVEMVLKSGHQAAVATQFCFDAQKLITWLDSTRKCLANVRTRLGLEKAYPPVVYHIGIPGPTTDKKLRRIAEICEVPSLFLGSAFDVLDLNGDGEVDEQEILAAATILGVEPLHMSELYKQFCGTDGVLQRTELAEVIAQLGAEGVENVPKTTENGEVAVVGAHIVAGPSVMVNNAVSADTGDNKGAGSGSSEVATTNQPVPSPSTAAVPVLPEEIVLALAAYCEQAAIPDGEVVLHFFPFGGVAKCTQLITDLAGGAWPIVDSK
jgi:5,10-methylenetetrahydrofolate reductase